MTPQSLAASLPAWYDPRVKKSLDLCIERGCARPREPSRGGRYRRCAMHRQRMKRAARAASLAPSLPIAPPAVVDAPAA